MLNHLLSSQNPIGINISDSSIKLAQIGSHGSLRILKKIRLPEGCVVNGDIINEEQAADALRDLIKEASKFKNITTKEAVCSLPEKITYLKTINVNKASGKIDDFIYTEISKYFPEEIDKLYIDWQIIRENKDDLTEIEVMVGAGRRDKIEKNIRIVENAGLLPILMEIESLATARALINEKKLKQSFVKGKIEIPKENFTIGILDIGFKTSNFSIFDKSVRFSINMPFSDERIISLISEALKIKNSQAKKAKVQIGLDAKKAKGVIKKILSPLIEEIAKIIKKIEEYHLNYNNGNKFDKIFICGGGASLLALDKAIEESTKIETTVGDATINLKMPPSESLKKETVQFEASIGSALIGYWLKKK